MKKLNLKQRLTDLIKTFKSEEQILCEAERKTPLHNKVNKIITIIMCIILFLAWLGSFPSSAADEPIESEQKYLSGIWEFNESPFLISDYGQSIHFSSSDGTLCTFLNFDHNSPSTYFPGFRLQVTTVDQPSSLKAFYFHDLDTNQYTWIHPEYKILDFGSIPQPVSDSFYSDFTSIAHPYNEQPMSYTIEEGVYIFDTDHEIFDIEGLTFTYPIPFYDLVYRTFDTLSIHSGYYENGHSYVDIYYDDTRVYKWETFTEPFLSQRGRMIYVTEDTEIAIQGAEAFETYYNYIPLMDYTDFDHCCLTFQFGFDAGFTDGKDVGYNDGYYDGYAEGYDSHGNAGVFGNFFDLVYQALDNIPVYESPDGVVSIIDVIQTILGGFILLFILKLIAGG